MSMMEVCDKELVVNLSDTTLSKYLKSNLSKDEITELKKINPYFNFSKRRVFHKSLDLIAQDCHLLFNQVPSLVSVYLEIKGMIDEGEFNIIDSEDKLVFVEAIDEYLLYNEDLISYVDGYVEDKYDICIEGTTKNNQLQFKDSHAKAILKVALLFRFVIPILSHAMHVAGIKKDDKLFLEMFGKIAEYFNIATDENGEEINIDINIKIQKFVETSVQNTLYSDKVIWNYLKNKSENEKTIAIELHRCIITSSLPKLQLNKSIVSFFHVILKKQLEYIFTSNFKVDYKPTTSIRADNDAVNPFMRIEQKLVRSGSEVLNVMQKVDIANFIKIHTDKIDQARLNHYMSNEDDFVIHTAQTKLLTFFIRKHVGPINVFSLGRLDYIKMVLIAKKWFENARLPFISFIMLARPLEEKATVGRKNKFSKGKISTEIISSNLYNNLSTMYAHLGFDLENDPILQFLGEVTTQDFNIYDDFDGTLYEPKEEINRKIANTELLRFIEYL